jgi:hypothetical protein
MKTRKHFIVMAIAIIALAIIGCKEDEPEPQPVPQSKVITIATGKTVTVNFTALPGTTPAWWGTLESAFQSRASSFDIGHYTLIVKITGTDGFVAGGTGSKTATVSESFLSTSDYTAMRTSMGAITENWIS